MRALHQLTLFLGAPGDLQEERKRACLVVEAINRTTAKEKGLNLEVVSWETDTHPAYVGDAQSLINAQIADMSKIDLFVGILWNRFGTKTPRAESGTEEELARTRNGNLGVLRAETPTGDGNSIIILQYDGDVKPWKFNCPPGTGRRLP